MKFKLIVLLLASVFLFSCGASKKSKTATKSPTTTKPVVVKPKVTPVSKPTSKPNETLEATSKVYVEPKTVDEYINQFKDVAKNNMINYKIPASITLAQGILESGAGKGRLCKEANNHFGIKCHKGWEGDSITHDDDAEQECFRKYNDPADSYRDHSLFLTSRSRYATLFELDILDYKEWAKGLKNAGYATDPKYPAKLIGIIERYNLNQYDEEVASNKRTITTNKNEEAKPNIKGINQVYTVQQGDTLYSLSKKFNTTVDELKRLNNLSDNSLSIGQKIIYNKTK
ncbi:glucosaminidase domain-containing protein [Flavobacterium sp.]|uniref:glucosaminidase domain-containing protein n=1 Tax=Flavobacterium sp. TaxID=239 RepID=UPI003526FF9C